MNLISVLLINVSISLILVKTPFWLPQLNMYSEKSSPYECKCGFDPMGSACPPFSMKLFLAAITFVLVDLEIALLLPLPWAAQFNNLNLVLITALMLMSMLALGLAYEWNQKGLEWIEYDN